MNNELISQLYQLQTIYEVLGDTYRERSLRLAITEIKKLKYRLTAATMKDFISTKRPGIGSGILTKIKDWIEHGRLTELDKLRGTREFLAFETLNRIIGVGPAFIKKCISQGIYTLADLRRAIGNGDIILTNTQKWGVRYYNDLNTRIPRSEVTKLGNIMKSILIQLDPHVIFELTGSYRRGRPDSGDVDILISNGTHFNKDLLHQLVQILIQDPNFIAVLSAGAERLTFLYRSHISSMCRQFDILSVAYSSYWASLLYFTGSYTFNTMMRGVAKSKGYRLNQHGLFKDDKMLNVSSEEDIFRLLGIEYMVPHLRE